jgi:hypothetical protein
MSAERHSLRTRASPMRDSFDRNAIDEANKTQCCKLQALDVPAASVASEIEGFPGASSSADVARVRFEGKTGSLGLACVGLPTEASES